MLSIINRIVSHSSILGLVVNVRTHSPYPPSSLYKRISVAVTTMNLDGTTTLEPTEFQQRWTQEHWMLQYDLMFGKGYALTRMGLESVAEPAKGK